MPITRLGLIAVADAAKQDVVIKGFADLVNQCKKVSLRPGFGEALCSPFTPPPYA